MSVNIFFFCAESCIKSNAAVLHMGENVALSSGRKWESKDRDFESLNTFVYALERIDIPTYKFED